MNDIRHTGNATFSCRLSAYRHETEPAVIVALYHVTATYRQSAVLLMHNLLTDSPDAVAVHYGAQCSVQVISFPFFQQSSPLCVASARFMPVTYEIMLTGRQLRIYTIVFNVFYYGLPYTIWQAT